MRDLAVIIPMYNEEDGVENCVRKVCEVLQQKLPGTKLLVVDDGSTDDTHIILNRLQNQELPFAFVSHSHNNGYGAALVTGIHAALEQGFKFALFMDSDLTNDPELIPKFAEVLQTDNYDLIKASRYISGGGFNGVPAYRKFFTILGNYVASYLFNMGIRDCTNGFHAVRLELLKQSKFVEVGFPFLLEELYLLKRLGARATEIPYVLTARKKGEGQSKFTYTTLVLWKYLKYAVQAKFASGIPPSDL